MTHLTRLIWLLVLWFGCLTSSARKYEGSRENSILLNGTWEFLLGDGTEAVESGSGERSDHWRQADLPGRFMTCKAWSEDPMNQTKVVWAHRDFTVTQSQADGLAVLRWNRIASGAAAFIDGHKVGQNEPTGPFQVLSPRA